MIKRQVHSKSRNGCRQCKTSRVKCDEARPTCKRCARLRVQCDYSALRYLRSEIQSQPRTHAGSCRNLLVIPKISSHTQQNQSSEILFREAAIYHARESSVLSGQEVQVSSSTKKFELRLLHSFMSLVSLVQASSAPGNFSQENIRDIFVLAMKHVYVRDILLGYSALYLRAYNPNDRALVEASHEYAARAIAECARQIQSGVHQGNAEGLFFTSVFIAKHAFASRQYDDLVGDNALWKHDELPILRWLRQFRGTKAIINAGWAWIPNSEHMSPLLSAMLASMVGTEIHDETVFSSLIEGLDETEASPLNLTAYRVTVAYLNSVIRDPDLRGLLGLPIVVPERLIGLLEERDPRAMAIIGSYLALFILSPKSAFLVAAVRREYTVIMEQLSTEWRSRVQWATGVIGYTHPEESGR